MKIESNNIQFGIDKIVLYTQDFQLDNKIGWRNHVSYKDLEEDNDLPTTIRTLDGKDHKGKLFSNQPNVSFNIDYRGLNATFNPSKMYHDYHLINTGDKLNESIQHIQDMANYVGLKMDVSASKISRLDCAIQGSMNHQPNQYADAYKLCNATRMGSRTGYEGGYKISNKSVATICYDKRMEMIARGSEIIPTENNLLRVENRFQKSASLSRHMKFNSIPILLQMHPQELKQKNSEFLSKKVFKNKQIGSQQIIDFNSEVELFQTIQETTKTGLTTIMTHLGMMGSSYSDTLVRFGGIEGYFQFLIQAGMNIKTAYKHKDKLMEIIRLEAKTNNRKTVTAADLLEELITKFAA